MWLIQIIKALIWKKVKVQRLFQIIQCKILLIDMGAPGGNFVAGMENGEPASFESLALPNVENPDSYHSYDVDNGRYCDAVDMVRNCAPDNMGKTIDNINRMIDSIKEEPGLDLDHIGSDDMKDMMVHYNDYQKKSCE